MPLDFPDAPVQSKGNVEEAVALMQKALAMDEKCEFAYETLGR